jgi:PKHD-type hydroxylase
MHGWNYKFPKWFSKEECETIIQMALTYPEKEGTVGHGGKGGIDTGVRRSTIRWIPRDDQRWRLIFDSIVLACLEANHKSFHLDLANYPRLSFEHAQFTTYSEEHQGEYKPHEDNTWVPEVWTPDDRKVSCSLQLSDTAALEGGRLILERTPDIQPLEQGDLMFFPSFHRHGVSPVTKGVRHSLVIWFWGPRLK